MDETLRALQVDVEQMQEELMNQGTGGVNDEAINQMNRMVEQSLIRQNAFKEEVRTKIKS